MTITKPTKPESPRTEYVTLEEAFQRAAKKFSGPDDQNLAKKFSDYFDEIEGQELSDQLSSQGFRKFAVLAAGTSGVTLQTTNGQVIRIGDMHAEDEFGKPREMHRTHVHEQFQAIVRGELTHLMYEVLPKFDTNVLEDDAAAFKQHLIAKGYATHDFDHLRGDLGYLPDGSVGGVDLNAINLGDRDKPHLCKTDRHMLIESDQESIFPYLHGSGFISKQEHFFPAIRDGRPRGVLTDADIQRLEKGELELVRPLKPECLVGITRDNLSEFLMEVRDFGWYPSQALEILIDHGHASPAARAQATEVAGR
jgi:hypothetical protein